MFSKPLSLRSEMGSRLHPIMQQALAPFAPKPISYTAPRCPGDLFRFDWDAGLAEDVVCHLEFHEEEIGARETGTGLQLEPDHQQHITLHAAYVRGLDIADLLSPAKVMEIAKLAMEQIEREAEQDREPV